VSKKKKKKHHDEEENEDDVSVEQGEEEQEEEGGEKADNRAVSESEDDESETIQPDKKRKGQQTYLEQVLSQQRAENKKARKRNVDSEELNEMDNKISAIISEMKNVAAVSFFLLIDFKFLFLIV
jgi:hypothetical protein